MNKNNKFLLKLWIPVLSISIIVSIMIFHSVGSDPTNLLILAVVFIFIFVYRSHLRQGINKALQQDNPAELINTIAKPLKSIRQKKLKESYIAYNTALSYVLYGHYEKAKEIMNEIEWNTKEPMFQALDQNIKSLINYFNSDIVLGISNARKAKALATISAFPGAKKSMEGYEAYIEIGQVLSGLCNDQILQSLELKYEKLPLIPKLIVAWGLLNGYKQRNEVDGYNRMLDFCTNNAPHCFKLSSLVSLNVDQEDINFS